MDEENKLEVSKAKLKARVLEELGEFATIKEISNFRPHLLGEGTLRNLKSKGTIPKDIFLRSPKGQVADMEAFMDWYLSRCNAA